MTPQEEIDGILREEDLPLTQDILVLNRKMRAETAIKRNELRELYEKFQADMDALLEKRQAIRERVLPVTAKPRLCSSMTTGANSRTEQATRFTPLPSPGGRPRFHILWFSRTPRSSQIAPGSTCCTMVIR